MKNFVKNLRVIRIKSFLRFLSKRYVVLQIISTPNKFKISELLVILISIFSLFIAICSFYGENKQFDKNLKNSQTLNDSLIRELKSIQQVNSD